MNLPSVLAWPLQTLAWSSICVSLSFAQDSAKYPNKPVHFVIPFAASGPTDTMARVLIPKLAERLEQPVIIDNKAGAGGSIGAEFVTHALPDG